MSQQLLLLMLIGYLVGVTSNHVPNSTTAGSQDCPTGCACSEDHIAHCGYAGLETIPHVPPKTRILFLPGNSITDIRQEDIVRMTHLEELHLHDNRIREITDETFQQLLRLRLLDLSHNPLQCEYNLKADVDLSHIEDESVTLQLLNLEGTMCSFPRHFRGRSISVLNSRAGDCKRREKRHARRGEFCLSNPCKNGGTCQMDRRRAWRCDCPTGYGGDYCQWREGDWLNLTIDDVSDDYIDLRWVITDIDVMDYRVTYAEDPMGPDTYEEQEWLDGDCNWYRLTDVKPDTLYKLCVAAFGFNSLRRSPGHFIEELCIFQRTDPVPSTTGTSADHKPPTPHHPTKSLDNPDNQATTKMVMTIFGIILSICIVLILAVIVLYVSRRRGIRLIPGRRRRSPPSIVQIDNPTYGSTGSPTPSVHDAPIEENGRQNRDNDIPLILVTSDSSEDIVIDNGAGFEGVSVCAETGSITSCGNESTVSPEGQTCGIDDTEDLSEREDGDGDSSHEDDFENGHMLKDNTEVDRPEEEVIQC